MSVNGNTIQENIENVEHVEQTAGEKKKKKILIEVDEDDPCLRRKEEEKEDMLCTSATDPRFQQQDQTLRCFVTYLDFFRCEHILGEGTEACQWFQNTYRSICPNAWIQEWDELRTTGRLAWHHRNQGTFPGHSYGDD